MEKDNRDMMLVVYEEEEIIPASKDGLFSDVARRVTKIGFLNTGEIAANLQSFCKQIGIITNGLIGIVQGYRLETLELSVDVTAKGEIRFVASTATELKGGLKLVFKKGQS
jgi:hypothetical protein